MYTVHDCVRLCVVCVCVYSTNRVEVEGTLITDCVHKLVVSYMYKVQRLERVLVTALLVIMCYVLHTRYIVLNMF